MKNEMIVFFPGVDLWGGFPSRAGTTEQFGETFLLSGELDRDEGTLACLSLPFFLLFFFLFHLPLVTDTTCRYHNFSLNDNPN
jgi:hypothetical protein